MKRINIPRDSAAHNSRLIRRPIQRMVWLFLLPTFAAFCIGFLYPFFKGAFLSFCKFKLTSQWTWVGFSNYIKALSDSSFLHAFWYTALFAFVSVVFINVLAFTVAYCSDEGHPRLESFPHRVLHAEPHRRHRARLHLVA